MEFAMLHRNNYYGLSSGISCALIMDLVFYRNINYVLCCATSCFKLFEILL
jgi:hypothetical protein